MCCRVSSAIVTQNVWPSGRRIFAFEEQKVNGVTTYNLDGQPVGIIPENAGDTSSPINAWVH